MMLGKLATQCFRQSCSKRLAVNFSAGCSFERPAVAANSARLVYRTERDSSRAQPTLCDQLTKLSMGHQLPAAALFSPATQKREYILPTFEHNATLKKTILDPVATPKLYELPPVENVVLEKLTPGLVKIVPIEDPHPLEKVKEQGLDIRKEAAVLVGIRRLKMKKWRKKKWRKRMKAALIIQEKKRIKKVNAEVAAREAHFATLSKEFDPEKFVDEHLSKARQGGFEIDIWAERKKKQQSDSNV